MPRASDELNFRSYYLGLGPTGVYEVDVVLSAVARAGKAYHYTADWLEDAFPEEPFEGRSWNDRIQSAGNDAAAALTDARAENARLKVLLGEAAGYAESIRDIADRPGIVSLAGELLARLREAVEETR